MGEDKPISPQAKISVIVPTIERDTLDSALASIYNQDLAINPEIIKVVDTERRGCAWAMNEGLKYVKTAYVFVCDDDVVLKPNALSRLLEALYYVPEAGYAYGDYEYSGHPVGGGSGIMKAKPFDPDLLMRGNYISTMSLIRTRLLREMGGWPEEYPYDWTLWKKMLEHGIYGVYSPGVLFTTRFDNDSLTEQYVAKLGLGL